MNYYEKTNYLKVAIKRDKRRFNLHISAKDHYSSRPNKIILSQKKKVKLPKKQDQ